MSPNPRPSDATKYTVRAKFAGRWYTLGSFRNPRLAKRVADRWGGRGSLVFPMTSERSEDERD